MDILKLTSGLSNDVFDAKSDDDFSDRLNYRYTVALLMFFTLILTTRQYSSEVNSQIKIKNINAGRSTVSLDKFFGTF